jgi:hypothetical protein
VRARGERIPSHAVVLNGAMRHRPLIAAAALAAAAACAAPASAKIVEVGRTDAAPACPATPCLALSRTTGYQVKVGDQRGAFTVPADGKIVAWSIALGTPSKSQVKFFEKGLGGPASAQLAILRPGKHVYSRVMAVSPVQLLQPYFGQTVQFALAAAIDVKKGWVLGLTVPTWAPALTPLLTDHSRWRASRPQKKCNDTATQTAQTQRLSLAQYQCLYPARLVYSATLVTNPVPTKPKR